MSCLTWEHSFGGRVRRARARASGPIADSPWTPESALKRGGHPRCGETLGHQWIHEHWSMLGNRSFRHREDMERVRLRAFALESRGSRRWGRQCPDICFQLFRLLLGTTATADWRGQHSGRRHSLPGLRDLPHTCAAYLSEEHSDQTLPDPVLCNRSSPGLGLTWTARDRNPSALHPRP